MCEFLARFLADKELRTWENKIFPSFQTGTWNVDLDAEMGSNVSLFKKLKKIYLI